MNRLDADAPINGDLDERVAVDIEKLDWTPSPSGRVWRKRLHRVGPAESGQVTSVVRYNPGAEFPLHDHPEGEEILVLDGVFSDEHGDWPAGTWLLNPEGFRHAPFSRDGCLLFVKLRQAAGLARDHVEAQTEQMEWEATEVRGLERKQLASQPAFEDSTFLERWSPNVDLGERGYKGGAEIFVMKGQFSDESGEYGEGCWLRLPGGTRHRPKTMAGCTLYVKFGGVLALRSA